MGGVMPRINPWSQSTPRVEIDQRSRDARIRFERTDEFCIVRRRMTHSRLRRLLYVFTVGRYGGLPHGGGEVQKPASDRWFLGFLGRWLKNAEICNCPGAFNF
jgi:hypothetical protein